MFSGSMTALITPFKNGKVDADALADFCDWQIEEGTSALVPCGTTGESPNLNAEERHLVIKTVVEAAAGRVPVIAGAGSNSTAIAIEQSVAAKSAGADGLLIVAPYYNKPTQTGLLGHFKAIHDATRMPMIIYNIPGRTSVDISIETMKALFDSCDHIVGIKDATGDLSRAALQRAILGDRCVQLSGDDLTAIGFNALGGTGAISVVSNVAPRLCADLQNYCLAGEFKQALAIQDRLIPLHQALFVETSPVPVKYALSLMGVCEAEVRAPLVELTEQSKAIVASALHETGVRLPAPKDT